jgi:hypothetical protein
MFFSLSERFITVKSGGRESKIIVFFSIFSLPAISVIFIEYSSCPWETGKRPVHTPIS